MLAPPPTREGRNAEGASREVFRLGLPPRNPARNCSQGSQFRSPRVGGGDHHYCVQRPSLFREGTGIIRTRQERSRASGRGTYDREAFTAKSSASVRRSIANR